MSEFDQTFWESYCDRYFDEFLSDTMVSLRKRNKEYQELLKEKDKILTKCPKLRDILENDEFADLSEDETRIIREYDLISIDIAKIEEKEIFIKGMKEAYFLFKKMNIID